MSSFPFTEIKDIDREILFFVTDESLFPILLVNKYSQTLDTYYFWKKRYLSKFIYLEQANIDYKTLYTKLAFSIPTEQLKYCSYHGYEPLVIELLKHNNSTYGDIITFLHEAVCGEQLEIVKYFLMSYDKELFNFSSSLYHCIDIAMQKKNLELTKILCEHIKWNFSVGWMGAESILSTSPEIVEMMWKYVTVDDNGLAAIFHYIVSKGNLEMTRYILSKTGKIFDARAYTKDFKMIELLLDYEANIRDVDIQMAVESGNTEMMNLLIRKSPQRKEIQIRG